MIQAKVYDTFGNMVASEEPGAIAFSASRTRMFYTCPCGCGELCSVKIRTGWNNLDYKTDIWNFDGDIDKPSLSPSIDHKHGCQWHGNLHQGQWYGIKDKWPLIERQWKDWKERRFIYMELAEYEAHASASGAWIDLTKQIAEDSQDPTKLMVANLALELHPMQVSASMSSTPGGWDKKMMEKSAKQAQRQYQKAVYKRAAAKIRENHQRYGFALTLGVLILWGLQAIVSLIIQRMVAHWWQPNSTITSEMIAKARM